MLVPVLVAAGVVVGWVTGSLVNAAAAVVPLRPVLRTRPESRRAPGSGAPAGIDGVPYAVLWLGVMLVCLVILALTRDLRVVAACISGVAILRVLSGWIFPASRCRNASWERIRLFLGMVVGLGVVHGVALALRDGGIRDLRTAVEAWTVSSVKLGLFVLVSDALTASQEVYRWFRRMPVVSAALGSVEGLLHRVPAAASAGLRPMLTTMLIQDVFDESVDSGQPVVRSVEMRGTPRECTHGTSS